MTMIRTMKKEDDVLKSIITTAVIILPFIFYLDLRPIIAGPIENIQVVKAVMAHLFCCMIVFYGLYSKGIPRNNFKSASILLFYLSIHMLVTPQYNIKLLGENVSGIWIAREFNDLFLFYIMVMIVSSIDWGKNSLRKLYEVICWISFLCSLYILIQFMAVDQWQNVIYYQSVLSQTNPTLTSFLGQSTFAGTFLALTIPFLICNRKIWMIPICLFAIFLTNSLTAFLMVGVVVLLYLMVRGGIYVRCVIYAIKGLMIYLFSLHPYKYLEIIRHESSGRIGVWKDAFMQVIHSPFPEIKNFFLTGYGFGSYEFIQKNLSLSGFIELHNEYLEFFCVAGIIGFTLLIFSLFMLIKKIFMINIIDRYRFAAVVCFFAVCFGNLIHFMWQLEPHRFYICIMLGIILNYINKEKKG